MKTQKHRKWMLQEQKIYCLQARPCIFESAANLCTPESRTTQKFSIIIIIQPGKFTGCGSEVITSQVKVTFF